MATIPGPSTQATAAVVASALLNNHRDALQFLLGSSMTGGGGRRPLVRATLTVTQSLTTGVNTALPLDSENVDYDAMHSTSTATSKLTAVTAGWYVVLGNVSFAANATGVRLAYIGVNGTERAGTRVEVASAGAVITGISVADYVFLNVGDYLEIYAQQTSGGALNVTSAALCAEWRSN